MFELEKMLVRCTSASTNSENKGKSDDTRLGMSMYFEFQGSNELLDKFDNRLRSALYTRASNDQQEDMMGHLPDLKFKGLKPLDWPYLGSGYGVVIHPDLAFSETIELEECKLDKFQFTFRDEGVTGFRFRIYFHPELGDVGKLAALEKHEVTITLTAPTASEEQKEAA